MSKNKRPEKPTSRFSASKNAAAASKTQAKEAAPMHRLRDEKSNVSPLDALRSAQNTSKQPSESFKPAQPPVEAAVPEKPVEKRPAPAMKPSAPEFPAAVKPAPVEDKSTRQASLDFGTTAANTAQEGSVAEPKPRAFYKKPEPVRAPVVPVVEPEPEFIDYIESPFKKVEKDSSNPGGNADALFDSFIKKTEEDDYAPTVSEDDSKVQMFDLAEPARVADQNIEEELLEFKRLTPEIGEDPDFGAAASALLAGNERRNKPRMRRVVFKDFKRRGSGSLPRVKKSLVAPLSDTSTPLERRLSAERYTSLESVQNPFLKKVSAAPSYRRRAISPSLKKAILEDKPHYSEYEQPESYDVNAPLPELIEYDFAEEEIPNVFVEGGLSVEEVLKAKRAERRDAAGNVKKDLPASDFVEEAFGEMFISYAEKHNKTYDQIVAPVMYSSTSEMDDELLDWVPMMPPEKPAAESKVIPAGVVVSAVQYDAEHSFDDYVDLDWEEAEIVEPVRASAIDTTTYKESYMENFDPELFMSDLFGDDNSNYVGVISELDNSAAVEAMSGVPVRAEGSETVNKRWFSANMMRVLGSVGLAVIAAVVSFTTGIIPAPLLGVIVAALTVFAVFAAVNMNRYKKFVVDFENQVVSQGKQRMRFDEIVWGEGSVSSSSKTIKLGSDEGNSFSVILSGKLFTVKQEDIEALLELINQSGIPYSSDNDLDSFDDKLFSGTKRNLSMAVNGSFMI